MSFFTSNIKKNNTIYYLLILLGFFSSISIFISDIIIFSILLIWILKGNFKEKLESIKGSNFSIAIIIFFMFYVFGLFWGSWNIDSWKWISKQALLLIIPVILSINIPKKIIYFSLLSFLCGMFINAFVSIGTYLDFWEIYYQHYPGENIAIGFIDHFDHSVFLAFSSILIIAKLIETNNIKVRIFCFIILILFITSLFLSHGRAGQYVFLIMLSGFLFVNFFKKPKYLIFSVTLIIASLIVINFTSSTFKNRFHQGVKESEEFFNLLEYSSENTADVTVTDTAIGDRLTYLINYMEIVKSNLWFGCGTGNSLNEYRLLKNKIFPNVPARPPHNNYLFILCEIGLIGLLLWLNIFIQLFVDIYKNNKPSRFTIIKFMFPIMFLLICFTDEYLVNHNSTLFFCFFTSLFCLQPAISIADFKFGNLFK